MICGIDEAGRGPLAGPVTAGAVVLPDSFDVSLLDDSKKLSPAQRRNAVPHILDKASGYGLGWVWPEKIDEVNIHHATLLAMRIAFEELCRSYPDIKTTMLLVDGKFVPEVSIPAKAVIQGDSKIPSIQAASILAKEARDRWMIRYSWIDNRFGFEKHKGYPTKAHKLACKNMGLSDIHRKSFRYC